MTISQDERLANIDSALVQMMGLLHDDGYVKVRFEREKDFHDIYSTSWAELESYGWIEDCSTQDKRMHQITGDEISIQNSNADLPDPCVERKRIEKLDRVFSIFRYYPGSN